jgi:predicted DsbA family dithiol-disulfide isomerase
VEEPIIEIIEFTDPYCTWCWGSEPILRKLKWVYGDQIRISYKMGGLVKDINEFYDSLNNIGGELWYLQVAEHWLEASSKHGMPVDIRQFTEYYREFKSTWPANIAVKAAELQNKNLAWKYLRRLREAAAAEAIPIHRLEEQLRLAEECGLDTFKMKEDIESGIAYREFMKDIEECKKRGITGFPTFLIRRLKDNFENIRVGYMRYSIFKEILEKISNNELKERKIEFNENEALNFIKYWGKVATQEIATLFNISKYDARPFLKNLENKGLIESQKAGNDYFWKIKSLCDPETGICGMSGI